MSKIVILLMCWNVLESEFKECASTWITRCASRLLNQRSNLIPFLLFCLRWLLQERKILEETVAPLKPCVTTVLPPPGDKKNVSQLEALQQNGHKDARGSEEQHASKVHFLQGETSTPVVVAKMGLIFSSAVSWFGPAHSKHYTLPLKPIFFCSE